MTEGWGSEPVGMLKAAVVGGDGLAARRALGGLPDKVAREDGLDLLARLAAGRQAPGREPAAAPDETTPHEAAPEDTRPAALAVELLIECLDETGVARRAVQGFLLDEAAVDDVTQDTLITVAGSVASFRGDAKFTTWLYQVARNRAVDHVRRQRATVPLDEQPEHGPSPTVRISSMIASGDAVQDLLRRVPGPYREVVRLRDVDRLSYQEIVDALGRNLNTVRSQAARGRALLAAIIEREGTGEEAS